MKYVGLWLSDNTILDTLKLERKRYKTTVVYNRVIVLRKTNIQTTIIKVRALVNIKAEKIYTLRCINSHRPSQWIVAMKTKPVKEGREIAPKFSIFRYVILIERKGGDSGSTNSGNLRGNDDTLILAKYEMKHTKKHKTTLKKKQRLDVVSTFLFCSNEKEKINFVTLLRCTKKSEQGRPLIMRKFRELLTNRMWHPRVSNMKT